ncbi:MAG: elongation factor P [Waddliaceae bacterium]|nr:elongation factor P [Waddliaceae bacterium]
MAKYNANQFKQGIKVEVEGQPFEMIGVEFVKPGKGGSFYRTKLKNLLNQRVIERTFKSNDSVESADVLETSMRLLYTDNDGAVFMDDKTFEQSTVSHEALGENACWLKEDVLYDIVFYQSQAIGITPPTFMELKITQTDPGERGNTASGRVLKPAELETGAKVQIPIFVDEGEIIKVDTRTGEYVARAGK